MASSRYNTVYFYPLTKHPVNVFLKINLNRCVCKYGGVLLQMSYSWKNDLGNFYISELHIIIETSKVWCLHVMLDFMFYMKKEICLWSWSDSWLWPITGRLHLSCCNTYKL